MFEHNSFWAAKQNKNNNSSSSGGRSNSNSNNNSKTAEADSCALCALYSPALICTPCCRNFCARTLFLCANLSVSRSNSLMLSCLARSQKRARPLSHCVSCASVCVGTNSVSKFAHMCVCVCVYHAHIQQTVVGLGRACFARVCVCVCARVESVRVSERARVRFASPRVCVSVWVCVGRLAVLLCVLHGGSLARNERFFAVLIFAWNTFWANFVLVVLFIPSLVSLASVTFCMRKQAQHVHTSRVKNKK